MSDIRTSRVLPAQRRWLGFAAVVVPLAILLALQLRTLAQLQETSAAAHRMTIKGYAKAVRSNVEEFYRGKASAALRLPAGGLEAGHVRDLEAHFAAQDSAGVKRYFAMPLSGRAGSMLFFDADGHRVDTAADAAEARAVSVATAPWRLVAEDGTAVESAPLVVVEQDRDNRVILQPIIDGAAHVRGVAGLVLDTGFFRDRYLPALLDSELALFPEPMRANVVVQVREQGATDAAGVAAEPGDELAVPFKFVFADWGLVVRSQSVTPEQWARWSFLINLSLSLILAAALVAALVSALRSAARATALSQMKTEFVSSVSHELRTPLSSIRVFGEFLRLGRVTDPDKVREYGEHIESESRRLTQLVDNILDFSKIESGQKRYRFEPADLAALVAETLATFAVRLKQDGFSVAVRAPQAPLPPAWADPPAVAQVLTNLIDNAVKYSGEAREISVELGQHNGYVSVAVGDRGPGIAVEEQARIFDKFYRVSTGLVHDAKGSGLGLAIVKHIVEAHRGTVAVRSAPGAGSTFTIQLPTHGA